LTNIIEQSFLKSLPKIAILYRRSANEKIYNAFPVFLAQQLIELRKGLVKGLCHPTKGETRF
jgi:hypothetical protein